MASIDDVYPDCKEHATAEHTYPDPPLIGGIIPLPVRSPVVKEPGIPVEVCEDVPIVLVPDDRLHRQFEVLQCHPTVSMRGRVGSSFHPTTLPEKMRS